jgi:cell division protein FtsW
MSETITTTNNRLSLALEAVVLTLMAVGTVFVFSAGANVRADYSLREFYNFTTLKQLVFFPLAVLLMYIIANIDHRRLSFTRSGIYKSFTLYLLCISIVLLVLVLIPGVGTEKNESRRWLMVPVGSAGISFQPSELAKWSIIFFLAAFTDLSRVHVKSFLKYFLPACGVAGLAVGLIVTQDFGTAAFITMLTFFMLLIAACRYWHFLTPMPILIPAFILAVVTSPTRMNRLTAFFRPNSDNPAYYQAQQSLIAISSGGIFGTGLGRGISKYGHLPEDTTDFIFAIIAEELGFVGASVVIMLYVIFVILGCAVVIRAKELFSRLLAAGIVLTIAVQAAINIGVVTKMLPTKGIPLPFISAGGTSMLLSAAAVGVLLNIARHASQSDLDLSSEVSVDSLGMSPQLQ